MSHSLPRSHRLIWVGVLLACGCLTSAFFFGSSNKEKPVDRDRRIITELYAQALEAEQREEFPKALELYDKATVKTLDFDKAHPNEDPADMQLMRTYCVNAVERIRFAIATNMQQHPVAVTPEKTPVNTNELNTVERGFVIPSRRVDGTASPAQRPAPVAPPAALPRAAPVAPTLAPPEEHIEMARDWMEMDRPDKAEEYLRAVLRATPEHTEARYLFALLNVQRGDFDMAKIFLEDLEEDAPSEAVYLLLGALHYRQQKFTEALGALKNALAMNPESAAVFYNQAVIFMDLPGMALEDRIQVAHPSYQRAVLLGTPRDAALEARLGIK